MNRARFDARKSGDQVFRLDPKKAARFARSKTGKMARICRASGDPGLQNCLEIAACPDGRQGFASLSAIFTARNHQNRSGL
ncbi:MAG: hypothetical protein O9333_06130 [Beijerinckiaceae bacterium]|jgi:hypothetical protein|nr:hypothetical protein [Beijerinckiaceae bacterium]